jgi:hypothetical protein
VHEAALRNKEIIPKIESVAHCQSIQPAKLENESINHANYAGTLACSVDVLLPNFKQFAVLRALLAERQFCLSDQTALIYSSNFNNLHFDLREKQLLRQTISENHEVMANLRLTISAH